MRDVQVAMARQVLRLRNCNRLVAAVFDVGVGVAVVFELRIPLVSCRLCGAENG